MANPIICNEKESYVAGQERGSSEQSKARNLSSHTTNADDVNIEDDEGATAAKGKEFYWISKNMETLTSSSYVRTTDQGMHRDLLQERKKNILKEEGKIRDSLIFEFFVINSKCLKKKNGFPVAGS